MAAVRAITNDSFASEVLQADKPVVVDFWATWCVPCRKVQPVIEELATTRFDGEVDFVSVDIDENPKLAQAYQVMSVPTIMVFKNGEVLTAVAGAQPKRQLERMIESAL